MKNVVFAYDGSPSSQFALTVLKRLLYDVELNMVYAHYEPQHNVYGFGSAWVGVLPFSQQNDAQKIVDSGVEYAKGLGFSNVRGHLLQGGVVPAWKIFIDYVQKESPDLVVVGSRGLHGLKGLFADSFSNHVSHHCLPPVLVVPCSKMDSEMEVNSEKVVSGF